MAVWNVSPLGPSNEGDLPNSIWELHTLPWCPYAPVDGAVAFVVLIQFSTWPLTTQHPVNALTRLSRWVSTVDTQKRH